MKHTAKDFMRRGAVSCGLGPMVLVVLYLILQQQGAVELLRVREVCVGIVSLTALAFIAGGMNVVYQIERLPLMAAILIHGCVLYLSYLGTYLINGWLEQGAMPLVIFTLIFVAGYFVIWGIIYTLTRKNTEKINAALAQKQQSEKIG